MFNKNKFIFVLIILLVLSFTINLKAESKYNWQELIETTKIQLHENEDDILLNYTLAVAYANTGEIKKAYDIIDIYGSSVSRKDFNTAVSPYLDDWKLYNDKNNLLLLNYAAFKEIINKNYQEAISLFEYIFEIDPNNLWALNHAAASLIEINGYDQALKYANQALEMQENEYSHLIKGVIYYENGNYFKALLEAANARNLFRALAGEDYQDYTD